MSKIPSMSNALLGRAQAHQKKDQATTASLLPLAIKGTGQKKSGDINEAQAIPPPPKRKLPAKVTTKKS